MASFLNDLRRQGNITSNYKVAITKPFNNLIVSNIKTLCNLKKFNVTQWWYTHGLICHKRQLHTRALCRPEQNILDHYGTCICVYPYFHFTSLLLSA